MIVCHSALKPMLTTGGARSYCPNLGVFGLRLMLVAIKLCHRHGRNVIDIKNLQYTTLRLLISRSESSLCSYKVKLPYLYRHA